MTYAVYNTNTGEIRQSVDIPDFMKDIVVLSEDEALVEIPRMAHDATEYIKDGKLTPKPDTNTAS